MLVGKDAKIASIHDMYEIHLLPLVGSGKVAPEDADEWLTVELRIASMPRHEVSTFDDLPTCQEVLRRICTTVMRIAVQPAVKEKIITSAQAKAWRRANTAIIETFPKMAELRETPSLSRDDLQEFADTLLVQMVAHGLISESDMASWVSVGIALGVTGSLPDDVDNLVLTGEVPREDADGWKRTNTAFRKVDLTQMWDSPEEMQSALDVLSRIADVAGVD